MTSYKTIVRGLITTYITDYLNRVYKVWVDRVRVDVLTISEGKCAFTARAVVASFSTDREYTIKGEVFSSGDVDISCVEVHE